MLKVCKISGFADEIDKSFDTQLDVLKELGQKYIELRSADGINIADMTEEKALELKASLQKAGIEVSALGSPVGKIKITEDFEPHFRQFEQVVKLAKLFGTPYIRMFSFYIPEGEEPEKYGTEVMERMSRLVEYAKEQGVVLLHENEKGIYGENAGRCKELMDAFYGENFGCTFDFANFVQCGQDTLEAYKVLEPYITYVHVKDAIKKDGEVVLPGDGNGNVTKIFGFLEQKGYQGFLSLEPHLFHFSGLEKLESGEIVKKEKNGIAAYKAAYHRLVELIGR